MKHLEECLNSEFSLGKKIYRLISLYRSPSQNQINLTHFWTIQNPTWKLYLF